MDPKLIQRISNQVYRRFPEVNGKKPRVRQQKPPANGSKAKHSGAAAVDPTYLLIFRGTGLGPGGRPIPRLVRVVASAQGKILKISTSRG